MSILQAPRPAQEQSGSATINRSRWRLPLLCMLLLLSVAVNVLLMVKAPPPDSPASLFATLWLLSFLPYGAACILILTTKAPGGRQSWLELGIILAGALVLRAMLLPIPPDLSHDSWRYLWDARVTLHGYSPYVYGPGDPLFIHLRDFVYNNSRFRNVPTIYPPGAQAIYLISYLLAPSNIFVLKAIFVGLDLVTCVALIFLLKHRGLDPARCIFYAWCPLPIVEFAIQGHLDASTLAFTALALLASFSTRRGARVLTGFLIAVATLTKIYPILLLVAVVRRRDWALLATCFATIVLAYIPYIILGHGQILGFFSTYASEQTPNAGVVPQTIEWISKHVGFSRLVTLLLEYSVDLLVVGCVSLAILFLRWRQWISVEAATLLLFSAIFAVSSHIFPWYTPALLPWAAMLIGPLWTRKAGWSGKSIAAVTAWYFACATTSAYLLSDPHVWNVYYLLVYDVPLIGLALAAIIGISHMRPLSEKLKRNIFAAK